MQSPEFPRALRLMDKSRPYFLYCRNGARCEKVASLMEEMGFRRVYYLMNGLQSWIGTLERSY
jgi:rhodanese-related sulfurtransferase